MIPSIISISHDHVICKDYIRSRSAISLLLTIGCLCCLRKSVISPSLVLTNSLCITICCLSAILLYISRLCGEITTFNLMRQVTKRLPGCEQSYPLEATWLCWRAEVLAQCMWNDGRSDAYTQRVCQGTMTPVKYLVRYINTEL